jgi:hypothetical protein
MGHQPSRTFRDPHPHEHNNEAEAGADEKREPPTDLRIDDLWVKEDDRAGRAKRGTEPVAAVDGEIGAAAIARRNEFLDTGIDRRVLPPMPRRRAA